MITFGDSMEAVEAFAGSDPEKAKYDDEDKEFLLKMEETSRNHRLFHMQ